MKIVYCTKNLSNTGGVQHLTIEKANALSQINGNEVWIAVEKDKGRYAFPIDSRVHIANLDVDYNENVWGKSRFHQFVLHFAKRKIHKRKIEKFLDTIKPDIVISTNGIEKIFLSSLSRSCLAVFVREIHLESNYRINNAKSLIDKIIARVGTWYDYKIAIKRYDQIVTSTNEDKERYWKDNKKVCVIPNFVPNHQTIPSSLNNKIVIAVGRLVFNKNFSSLIRSWSYVHRLHPDWKLNIYGDGSLKNELRYQINDLGLQDAVFLMGGTNDLFSRYLNSSVFVMSSLYEGSPLAMLEAMSCGLPVVSYDFPCGPKDNINNGENGFLIPVGDEQMMAKRINYLIENENVRRQMGIYALEKSKMYSKDIIIQKWMSLFTELDSKKTRK